MVYSTTVTPWFVPRRPLSRRLAARTSLRSVDVDLGFCSCESFVKLLVLLFRGGGFMKVLANHAPTRVAGVRVVEKKSELVGMLLSEFVYVARIARGIDGLLYQSTDARKRPCA